LPIRSASAISVRCIRDQAREPLGSDPHLKGVLLDVDPLDQEIGAGWEDPIMHRSGRTYGL
jgi:hypothetical protein